MCTPARACSLFRRSGGCAHDEPIEPRASAHHHVPFPITLAHTDSIALAVVRRRANPSQLAGIVPQACGLVWEFVRSRQIPAGRHVAVYLNGAIDLEIGVEVQAAFAAEGDVVPSSTPSGLTASTVHFGPYQRLGGAHEAIRSWCAANAHQMVGPSWEIYDHWQPEWNSDPSRIRTDVLYRVAPGT